jgi:hypothetical protein
MKLKYINVEIRLSELTTVSKGVAAWELPILEAVHPGAVEVKSERFVERASAPDVNGEFQRLTNLYGDTVDQNGSKGLPFAATVYGQFGVGNANLAKAIAAATLADEAPSDLLGADPVSSVGG